VERYNDILLKLKMIERGIIPCDDSFSASKLHAALKTLSFTKQRVAKRKFRRAWRNIVKSFKNTPEIYENMKHATGMGLCQSKLTYHQRLYRINLVRMHFMQCSMLM